MLSKLRGRLRALFPAVNYLYLFSGVAVVIVAVSLWYSNKLVGQLTEQEERLVNFWASSYKFMTQNMSPETEFIVNNFVLSDPPVIKVPAIVADEHDNPIMYNFNFDSTMTEDEKMEFLKTELERMKSSNLSPIPIEYVDNKYQYVWYRETDELIQLRYFPYVTFLVLFFFIGVIFINFNIAKRSQQNKVWAGLAKETAHQLGTPISGLIAWIELLKLKVEDEDDEMIVKELERDIYHLQIIAERFSKIGSEPEFKPNDVSHLLEDAVAYVERRVSKKNLKVTYDDRLPANFKIHVMPSLVAWVIENLLKNAADAIGPKKEGRIHLTAEEKNGALVIEVEDNGKGIPRNAVKSVFRPGFTTKKRGWGLGLSLSKRIIDRFHRGKIFVKKTEVGKGTTFRIELPPDPRKVRRWRLPG